MEIEPVFEIFIQTFQKHSFTLSLNQLFDISKDGSKSVKYIDVVFGARSCLKHANELDSQTFKTYCKKFLCSMFAKPVAKNPWGKRAVIGGTCISVMLNETQRMARVKVAIEELVVHNQISPAQGDVIYREYVKLCDYELVQKEFKDFNWKNNRLDELFCKIFAVLLLKNMK